MFSRFTICNLCPSNAEQRALHEVWIAGTAQAPASDRPTAVIDHDGACVVRCANGHSSVIVYQGGACALLYERALHNLADESTRDAVLDGYTALEMYLSTVSERVLFEASPRSDLVEVRRRLKQARKTSERATAAALATIVLRTGREPPLIDDNMSKTRNEATHAGLYPSVDDAERMLLKVAATIGEFETCFDESHGLAEVPYHQTVHLAVFAKQRAERQLHFPTDDN